MVTKQSNRIAFIIIVIIIIIIVIITFMQECYIVTGFQSVFFSSFFFLFLFFFSKCKICKYVSIWCGRRNYHVTVIVTEHVSVSFFSCLSDF